MRSLIPIGMFALAACGAPGGDPSSSGGVSGNIELRLIDAPATDVTEIVVTITSVEAHVVGSGWVPLSNQTKTVDLLKLQGGTFALLGVSKLPAGRITQIRLNVPDAGPNYVTTPDTKQHPLLVPSGDESGLKLKVNFEVEPCAQGAITLDWDGKKSIFTHPVGAGAGDEWILRPVIRLVAADLQGNCSDGGSSNDGGSSSDSGSSTDGGSNDSGGGDGSTPGVQIN